MIIKLDTVRRQQKLEDIVKNKHESERQEMDLRKLTDKELVDIINNTSDIKLLALAENEYVDRHVPETEDSFDDDEIEEAILKTWRPS